MNNKNNNSSSNKNLFSYNKKSNINSSNLFLSKNNSFKKVLNENIQKKSKIKNNLIFLNQVKNSTIKKCHSNKDILNNTNNSFFNCNNIKLLKNEINSPENILNISKYLENKKKRLEFVKQFKNPRIEIIKILLNETLSDKDIFNKTFSKNFVNSEEYKSLNNIYKENHIEKINLVLEKNNKLLKKYFINNNISNSEKIYLNSIKNRTNSALNLDLKRNKSTSNVNNNIQILSNNYYFQNQYESFKSLKLNKKLHDKLLLNLDNEQIKVYLKKFFNFEEEKLKLALIPPFKSIPLGNLKKSKKEIYDFEHSLINNKVQIKNICFNLNDKSKFTRKNLFIEYNCIYLKMINNFLNTPPSRSESQLIQYYDDFRNEYVLILYGGMNFGRLDDIWECRISNYYDVNGNKKYRWNKINIKGEKPQSRSGHTAKIYKNNIIIYGGIIEDEKTLHIKEDVLIYDINEKKFSNDTCLNKQFVSWRKYHIAEIIGQFMLIYGGMDENGKILSEPWALDLYRMKWISPKFSNKSLFPKVYLHSSCQVFNERIKFHPKFSLFKIYNEKEYINFLKYEGIYIFGGINDEGKYMNDIYIIKRGKPLHLFKPNTDGKPPSPRCQCTINFFEKLNCLIIYGGRNEYMQSENFFNDFYFLDLERMLWISLEYNENIHNYPRCGHVAEIVDNELIIFGGYNDKFYLKSDLMICNLDIIESYHLAKKYKKSNKKKEKSTEEMDDYINFTKEIKNSKNLSNNTNSNNLSVLTKEKNNKLNNENINHQYIFINNHAQTSKSFFDKFPEQKLKLKEKLENVEKITFVEKN